MKFKRLLSFAMMLTMLTSCVALFAGCSGSKETVIIYSSAEDYRIEHMQKRLNEQFPQYNVIVEYKTSGNHAATLQAAGKNAECDISHDLEYAYAEQLAAQGVLADLTDLVDWSVYAEDTVQSKYYAPEIRNGGCIIVNTQRLTELGLDKPTSYADLLDPKYKGLISMPNPASSGTGYMFLLSLVNAWGEQAALDYFDQLSENVLAYTSSGSGPVNSLVLGEVAIGLGMTPNAATKIGEGFPLEILFFEEGSPYSLYGQAIVEGKQEREAVKEVFAFLTTTLNEELCAYYYPEKIFKDKDYVVQNFPTGVKYANMQVENAAEYKEYLLSKWTH